MGKAREENKIVLKGLITVGVSLLIIFGLNFLQAKYNFIIFHEPDKKIGVITLVTGLVFISLIINIWS